MVWKGRLSELVVGRGERNGGKGGERRKEDEKRLLCLFGFMSVVFCWGR